MSHFSQLLQFHGLTKHDGRALWRYGISDDFFRSLRTRLASSRYYDIDPKDCTLYYAAWWKCCYDGGSSFKKAIFESIAGNQMLDEELFYEMAKKGAESLRIPWIKQQNTLFVRTMLLQGGLPMRHVTKNESTYTRFMLKILEMSPGSIDDFAFNPSITSILPPSSRNDAVYSSCLEIVKKIVAGEESFLSEMEEDETISRISKILIRERRPKSKTKPRFRTAWVFEECENQLRLYLSIPTTLEKDDFNKIFLQRNDDEDLQHEYNLFYGNRMLCKFIRNAAGNIKTDWFGQHDLIWEGNDKLTELYLIDADGKRHDSGSIISHVPQTDKPTLWSKYSDGQWVLEKGMHTSQEEAAVLFPDGYQSNSVVADVQQINIRGYPLQWLIFNGETEVTKNDNSYLFKSKSGKIEWFIADEKPDWMLTANLPVIQRQKPTIHVYDERDNIIPAPKKQWRQKGKSEWHKWEEPMGTGLLEILIEANEVTEVDEIFRIGNLDMQPASTSLHHAEVSIGNTEFVLAITTNPLVSIAQISSKRVQLTRLDTRVLPKSIHASLTLPHQRRGLLFEINPPFKGFEIIDNQQQIVSNGSKFKLTALGGYRLLTNEEGLTVTFYNSSRKNIVLSEKLLEPALPLKHFEEKMLQLYSLSDPTDGGAEIVMEIGSEKNASPQKEYHICRYDQKITWEKDEAGTVTIQTQPALSTLFAVPVDCTKEEFDLYDLEEKDGVYRFRNPLHLNRYVVFGSADSKVSLHPVVIHLDETTGLDSEEERMARILHYREALLGSQPKDDVWEQLHTYYGICTDKNLSFATFDILKAISFSSELAAKAFLFLLCKDYSERFLMQYFQKLESDLGLFFHWVAYQHWQTAIDWVDCVSRDASFEKRLGGLRAVFDNQPPGTPLGNIYQYVKAQLQEQNFRFASGFPLNQKIAAMRGILGLRAQSGIPQSSPPIPVKYQYIIPVSDGYEKVKLLLNSPVSVALSIAGKNEAFWSENHEYKRRNVKYSYDLHPEWYSEAILYTLSKI